MNRKLVNRKGTDIRNAGRLFFDALFGQPEAAERRIGEDSDRAAAERGDREAIPASGHCSCGASRARASRPSPSMSMCASFRRAAGVS